MTEVSAWSQTDASNNSAAPAGAPELMLPGGLNDTIRAMQGANARRYARGDTPTTTAGTSTAYTVTYSVAPAAYASGETFLIEFHTACGASPTANINALGAIPLHKYDSSAGTWGVLAASDLLANTVAVLAYNTSAGSFRIIASSNGVGIQPNINGMTAETAPAVGDLVPLYDVSAAANRKMTLADLFTLAMPTGAILNWPTGTAPTGFLSCDGTAVSRATYAALFAVLVTAPGLSGQTFSVTIASPGVATKASHGFTGLERLRLTTSGALPTGLTAGTEYYVIYVDANTFKLATSEANAAAGTAINTSGSQSGTHTYTQSLYGLGDGSTTFNLPDFRDVYLRGTPASGATIGTYRKDAMQGHRHVLSMTVNVTSSMATRNALGNDEGLATVNNGAGSAGNPLVNQDPYTDGTNGTPRTASETRPVTRYATKIIKY